LNDLRSKKVRTPYAIRISSWRTAKAFAGPRSRVGLASIVQRRHATLRNLPGMFRLSKMTTASSPLTVMATSATSVSQFNESLSLYLASRLMTDRVDRFNPHAASAVRKLVAAEAEKVEGSRARRDPVYLSVLETLTRGWSESRIVKVLYHSVHRNADDTYLVAVYLIVPYAVGQTVQAIGQCVSEDHLRTLRIDRILQATLTPGTYVIPTDQRVAHMLENAWGIWYSDAEPVDVVLRFSAHVAHRVRETVRHASQELTNLPSGELVWSAYISEPREMLPWIRGWGADVEVLAPAELRQRIAEETRAMAKLYAVEK